MLAHRTHGGQPEGVPGSENSEQQVVIELSDPNDAGIELFIRSLQPHVCWHRPAKDDDEETPG